MVCTLLAGVNVVAFAADGDTEIVFKFYSDVDKGGTGEHLFTKDQSEISWLSTIQSWNNEGEAWKAPVSSSTAVYRCFNPNSGEHLYVDEGYASYLEGIGWNKEKVAFYSDDNKGVPVYRLWNGLDGIGSHHFTTNEGEVEWLLGEGWQLEDVACYGVKEEQGDLVAEQTGSNTITAYSSIELTDDADVTVTKGSTEQDAMWVLGDDGKTITILTTSKITGGEYTVSVTPDLLGAETMTATFAGENERLAGLNIAPVLALDATDTTFKTAMTTITGANQFGEDYNLGSGTVNVYPSVAAVAASTKYDASKKTYTLKKDSTIPFQKGDQVTLTAIYTNGTEVVQSQQTCTVSDAPYVANMEFGELDTTNALLKGQRVTVKNFSTDTYYIPVVATSQYGAEFTADQLNGMVNVLKTLFVNPDDTGAFGGFMGFDELDDGTVVMCVGNGANQSLPGTATISVAGIGGLATSTQYTVVDNPYIDSMTVMFPSSIYQNTTTGFAVSAVDQYGDPVDLYNQKIKVTNGGKTIEFGDENTITKQGSSISVNNGTLAFEKNSSDKSVVFAYTPAQTATNDVCTVTTATPNVNTIQLTIGKEGTPASIQSKLGDTDPTTNMLSVVPNWFIDFGKNLVFVDSNGQVIGDGTTNVVSPAFFNQNGGTITGYDYYYTIDQKVAGQAQPTAVTASTVAVTQNTDYTVKLYKAATTGTAATTTDKVLDTKTFKAKVLDPDQVVSYMAVVAPGDELLKNVDANITTKDDATVLVYGTDASGVTALLPAGTYLGRSYFDATVDNYLQISDVSYVTTVKPEANAQEASSTVPLDEGEATVTIWNPKGEEVAEATLEYSNAPSKPVMWAWTRTIGGKTVLAKETVDLKAATQGAITVNLQEPAAVPANSSYRALSVVDPILGGITYNLVALDQYGLSMVYGIDFAIAGKDMTPGTDATFTIKQPTATVDIATTTIKADIDGLPTMTINLVRQ